MRKWLLLLLLLLYSISALVVLAGCSDNGGLTPTNNQSASDAAQDSQSGVDAGDIGADDSATDDSGDDTWTDQSPDKLVGNADIAAQLRRPVTVMTDDFGMRHVFAESLEDLFFINGYTYATDRFAQMEFYRRIATGTLGELFGGMSTDATQTDVLMRTLGLKRSAETYLSRHYDPDSEAYQALMAYCAGVNAYLAQYRAGEVSLPAGMSAMMPAGALPDWQPADVMALGKLLALQLTYSAPTWIEWHGLRQAIVDNFSPDASDPALAGRHGFLADMLRLAPATDTTHIEGFPDTGSRAIVADDEVAPDPLSGGAPKVKSDVLQGALALHDGLRDLPAMGEQDIFGRRAPFERGSNNWVLAGARTESGFPNVANDPHLGLSLPTVFYPIHLELRDDIDGRRPLKMLGASLLGLPGVVVGRTDKVAWGTTVGNYDYTDVYAEEITGASDGDKPATVRRFNTQVAVERIVEPIKVGTFGEISKTVDLVVEVVPHHGPILPTTEQGLPVARRGEQALSVRWVGLEPSHDLAFLMALWRAETPADAEAALNHYTVGSSNFVFGFSSGETFYSGQSDIPLRQRDALSYDPIDNPSGNAPIFILPGTGGADWDGFLDERRIPHVYDPQKGYIVTANNDPVGTTLDNNPFDARYYLGGFYDIGFRAQRITELIEAAGARGDFLSLDDQIDIQNDGFDKVAERLVPHIVNGIDAVLDASINGSQDPEVQALLDHYGTPGGENIDVSELVEFRNLLDDWDFEAPATRNPTGENVARSAASSLFNGAMVYILELVYADEFRKLEYYSADQFRFSASTQLLVRSLLHLVENTEQTETFDPTAGDSRIFDNLDTPDLVETRISAFVTGVMRARQRFAEDRDLAEALGRPIPSPASSDHADWVWGKMHGLVLDRLIPIPSADFQKPDAERGLPFYERPGGQFAVSPCDHGYDDFDFTCASGSSLRMVHDMNPAGPVTYNAIPGGYSADPESPAFMSEMERWNRAEPRKLEDDPDLLEAAGAEVRIYQAR